MDFRATGNRSFNSIRGINPGAYSTAAQNVVRDFNQAFNVVRKNSPNYQKLADKKLQTNSEERIESMKQAAELKSVGFQLAGKLAAQRNIIDAKVGMYKNKMNMAKAGVFMDVLGAAATAGMGKKEFIPPKKVIPKPVVVPEPIDYGAFRKNLGSVSDYLTDPRLNGGITPTTPSSSGPGGASAGIPGLSGPTAGGDQSAAPILAPTTSGENQGASFKPLTDAQKTSLKFLRSVESAGHGYYDAFNLGGTNNGRTPIGSGNSANNSPFGVPVSQLSLGQIKDLHASGQAHAMGAYQFTGAGALGEAQASLGLPDSTIFSPEIQDQLALAYGQSRPNSLSQAWVGYQNLSPIEQETVRRGFL